MLTFFESVGIFYTEGYDMKRKFKVSVIRYDDYEIELDDEVLTEDWMKEWRQQFYSFTNLRDHAEHLAQLQARFGDSFLEGYGHVRRDGEYIWPGNTEGHKDDLHADGINIKIINEDNCTEIDTEEITEESDGES